MVIQLRARGFSKGLQKKSIGRVSLVPIEHNERADIFRVIKKGESFEKLDGYLAALFEEEISNIVCPAITGYESLDFLKDGYVISIEPATGFTRILYRQDSPFNTIFITDNCNSNCLMCSQPPKNHSTVVGLLEGHLRHINLIPNTPKMLGITGGEPTLLGNDLVKILSRIYERFPETSLLMLSNGRMYAHEDLVREIAKINNPYFTTAIPLYANIAPRHDFVVQSKGAFDQTIQGLYNMARYGLKSEIRVVLHKQTIPYLIDLMDFIYRNLPFVSHVALMGLEHMGYVKKNWDMLWVDPLDYSEVLEKAVRFMWYRKIHVSIYNLPLCLIPKNIWAFARKSISDYKNIYLDECNRCQLKQFCSGLFQYYDTKQSRGIKAMKITNEIN